MQEQHKAFLLRTYLKLQDITQESAARQLGYTVNYLNTVLTGRARLTPAVKEAFMRIWPETALFLLPESVVESLKDNDGSTISDPIP